MKTKQIFKVVGTNAHRVDAIEKVSGKAIYTSDIQLPGMAHARILRSPVAHARLVKVDASKAKEFPGVIATLTRDDIQGFNFKYGATYKDQSIVAVDKVRYVGDPVAAVLADTPDIAEQALELIEVEYDELAKVTNLEEAMAAGAIQVHEGGVARAELRGSTYGAPERFSGTNICYYLTFGREEAEKGFAKADHIFEDTFRFQKVQHFSLEAHNNVAYYDGEKLTVWASCQDPFTLRDHLSAIFRLPCNRIRVIVPYVGGGYGGKLYVKAEPISAALSWMTRRPVKLQLSINESFKTVTRHPARVTVKTGVTKDGKLIARDCQVYMDTGAYADAGPRVTQKAGYRALGPYRIPYAKVEAYGVYTNTVPAGAFRGFGALQVTWAYESQMDMIAERLGIDPLEFRIKNLTQEGRSLYRRRYAGGLRHGRGVAQSRRRHQVEREERETQPRQRFELLHQRRRRYLQSRRCDSQDVVRRQRHVAHRHGRSGAGAAHGAEPDRRRRTRHVDGSDRRRPARHRCHAL